MLRNLLVRFWVHLPFFRKTQLIILMVMNVFSSLLEVISIGFVIPFMGALLEPARVLTYPSIRMALAFFNVTTQENVVIALTLFFCLSVLISGAVRLVLMWWQAKLSYEIGADFSAAIYNRALRRNFAEHLKINSSDTISAASVKAEIVVRQALFPVLTIASSVLMSLAILILLCFANLNMTLVTIATFGLIYLGVNQVTKIPLANASKVIDAQSGNVLKVLQEGLGSMRDIIIDGNQDSYLHIYSAADKALGRARSNVLIISQAPRYVIEAGGLIFIGILAFYLSSRGGLIDALPSLVVLALGVQRLLPVLQQAYAGWACVRGSEQTLATMVHLLDEPLASREQHYQPMPFYDKIEFEDISYGYDSDRPDVLKNVSFYIPKGSTIGIVGKTGSGKSTLLDICMGLLTPTKGVVRVDGVAVNFLDPRPFYALIAHVPQSIYIFDATIKENIAFGVNVADIDLERVKRSAEKSQLLDFVNSLPQGFDTIVGERGTWLSGGQRQRLGIARALYKSAQVIILDEATSALDGKTEASVIEAIESLGPDITLVMVAHRVSTLQACDKIIELHKGSIHRVVTYSEFTNSINLVAEKNR